jgi:hypothetical protein
MHLLPIAVLVLGLPVLLGAFLAFDELVLLERARHPADWARDGQPRTFFRRWREFDWSLRSGLAQLRCTWRWLFASPYWARGDPDAARLLRRHRVLVACWCFLVVPALILAVTLAVIPTQP